MNYYIFEILICYVLFLCIDGIQISKDEELLFKETDRCTTIAVGKNAGANGPMVHIVTVFL